MKYLWVSEGQHESNNMRGPFHIFHRLENWNNNDPQSVNHELKAH